MDTSIRDQLRKTLRDEVAPAFRPEVPLAQQRQVLDAMGAAAPLPEGVVVDRRELAGLPAEWLRGPGADDGRLVLHYHGGGYCMGTCASHRLLTALAAQAAGARGLIPEYRLAPEHPFPAALDDGVAIYRALLAAGHRPDQIILLGDSAGGGLALAVLHALRDAGDPLPAAAVLLSPLTDLTFSGESVEDRAAVDPWLTPALLDPVTGHYVGEHDRSDPRLSPLFADHRGLPPLLIHVGDHEILLSDATRLADRARAAGVDVTLEIWPELWHVFHLFAPALPEANTALTKIGAFARAHLGVAEAAT